MWQQQQPLHTPVPSLTASAGSGMLNQGEPTRWPAVAPAVLRREASRQKSVAAPAELAKIAIYR